MNATDEARLALAKRAYQAMQPRELEVQGGVRRARLALLRPKRRRNWFSKGLVLVVLALGSLAYAKPHGVAELVERWAPRETAPRPALGAASLEQARTELSAPQQASDTGSTKRAERANAEAATTNAGAPPANAEAVIAITDSLPAPAKRIAPPGANPTASAPHTAKPTRAAATLQQATTDSERTTEPTTQHAVSDWGRVGQALAQGDDAAALTALKELAQSDDDGTRDKADLGRAQLLLAHGASTEGCALARALTHRRAGSRIERQAALLLETCRR